MRLVDLATWLATWLPRSRRGRPQEFSPKARLLNLLGYRLPFDRHDWVVDRCGEEVR